jgi:hypothetical protein
MMVLKFMHLLPRGTYSKNGVPAQRNKTLIEVYTDPGGIRILAAADIRFKDPGAELKVSFEPPA